MDPGLSLMGVGGGGRREGSWFAESCLINERPLAQEAPQLQANTVSGPAFVSQVHRSLALGCS